MFKSGKVSIMVSDLIKAVQFYVETLELNLQHQMEGHLAVVETPGVTISLLQTGGNHGSQPGQPGNLSIGFEVESLDSAVETLKSRRVEFQHIMEDAATRLAHFSDPEGNPLYLIEI